MAWTYFTAPLTAGEELTANMWYELCEALAERFVVTGQSAQVNLTAAASIRDARLQVRGVPITRAGTTTLEAWTLNTGGDFAASDTAPGAIPTLPSSTEWTAEGLTEAEWNTLKTAVAAGWNDRRYWNIIRASIQRLQVARFFFDASAATRNSKFVDEVDWATALTAYAAASPTTGALSSFNNFVSTQTTEDNLSGIVIGTQRVSAPRTLPSADLLATATVWTFLNVHSEITPTEDYSISFAGTTTTGTLVDGTDIKFPLASAVDVRGAQTLTMELSGYANPSPFEPPAPDTSLEYLISSSDGPTLYAYVQVNWSKP